MAWQECSKNRTINGMLETVASPDADSRAPKGYFCAASLQTRLRLTRGACMSRSCSPMLPNEAFSVDFPRRTNGSWPVGHTVASSTASNFQASSAVIMTVIHTPIRCTLTFLDVPIFRRKFPAVIIGFESSKSARKCGHADHRSKHDFIMRFVRSGLSHR